MNEFDFFIADLKQEKFSLFLKNDMGNPIVMKDYKRIKAELSNARVNTA